MAIIDIKIIKLTDETVKNKFYNNIKITLQKLGTSHKTRALHPLMVKQMLLIGVGSQDLTHDELAKYGTYFGNDKKLSGLIVDIGSILKISDLNDVMSKVNDMHRANAELSRIRTTITDTSELQMNRLKRELNKIQEEIIDSIDYFSLIDAYYFLYIHKLCDIGLQGKGKNKLFETTYDIFKSISYKVNDRLSIHNTPQINIILDYIFARLFTNQTGQTILSKLSRMYGKEEVQFLVDVRPTALDELKHLAQIYTKAQIVNVTESVIINSYRNVGGEDLIDIMKGSFSELISYLISAIYKSPLFTVINIDKDKQVRLEELVLNFKRELVIG